MGRKGGLHSEGRQVPRKRVRASKESLPRNGGRKHQRMKERKSSPGGLKKSWCTPSLAKPEMGKKISRRRARSYDEREKRVRITCRGGGDASERRSGLKKNEKSV